MITVVLDDDPTGPQAMIDVPVVIDWNDEGAWDAVGADDSVVHVLTNSRAYDGDGASAVVQSAARAARSRLPEARIVLRGDSTLRAHLWEEYEALRTVVTPGVDSVPLLLVPALPTAGRVTVGGVHLLERDGARVPLHATEYALDGVFAYGASHLPTWAEERSGGRFSAVDAQTVGLAELRAEGGAALLAAALAAAARRGRPAVVVPDVETNGDLAIVGEGVVRAEAAGTIFVVRAAPAFVASLRGADVAARSSTGRLPGRLLVLCGSFVPLTTRQIERLADGFPDSLVAVRAAALVGEDAEAELRRTAAAAEARLREQGLAVVATERERDPTLVDPAAQRVVAHGLAQVARRVEADAVVAKGGITSAVTVRDGLDARSARVVGPVVPGVSHWRLDRGSDFFVVPGNVGGADLLLDLVSVLRGRPPLSRRC